VVFRGSGSPASRKIIALAIAAGAVLGSALVVYTSTLPQGHTIPPPSTEWATFDGSEPAVQRVVQALPGGPWNLTFAQGVAASGPWSTPATWISLAWDGGMNVTINNCLMGVEGISVISPWNNSLYPVVTSPNVFTSGSAPLWTYIFQGISGARVVASWYAGTVTLNDRLPAGSPCAQLFPLLQNSGTFVASRVVDSSIAAQQALKLGGSAFLARTTPAIAVYVLGSPYLGWTGGPLHQWTIEYGTCGLQGSFGQRTSFYDYAVNLTTGKPNLGGNGSGPCFRWLYDLHLQLIANQSYPGAAGYSWEWNESISFLTSQVPTKLQATSLTTDLFGLSLFTNGILPFTVPIPSAAAVCTPTHPGVANCTPPAHGWYGVLLGANGSWLDSFPSVANGSSWTVPGALVVPNGDRLLLVASPGAFSYAQFGTSSSYDPFVLSGAEIEEPG
jgi:hypothetical protein